MKTITNIARRKRSEQAGGQFHRGSSRDRVPEILPRLILLLLFGCLPARAQNTAGLSIGGTVPAIQRLEISSAGSDDTAGHPFTITLNTRANMAASYAVTIQSKTLVARPDSGKAAYVLTCNGDPITLAAGAATILPEPVGDRSAPRILQISQPSVPRADTLSLTIISQ